MATRNASACIDNPEILVINSCGCLYTSGKSSCLLEDQMIYAQSMQIYWFSVIRLLDEESQVPAIQFRRNSSTEVGMLEEEIARGIRPQCRRVFHPVEYLYIVVCLYVCLVLVRAASGPVEVY